MYILRFRRKVATPLNITVTTPYCWCDSDAFHDSLWPFNTCLYTYHGHLSVYSAWW
jgi:hypothetical protein